jgi:DNA-binding CsgD family transcriptional regulator
MQLSWLSRPLIDYDFEARLVDRIAAKEAIAARLNPKQRRILLRYTRYGETYREISRREGLSVERVRQHHFRALDKLSAHLAKADRPQPTTRSTPPLGFDKAAFLRHMRGLITLRDTQERELFETERTRLERALEYEKEIHAPKPKQPAYHFVYNGQGYAPPPLPTNDALSAMAHEALRYLLQARPQYFCGTPWLGKWATSVVFTRDGGSVSEAVNSIVRELPATAHLSAFPVAIEQGTLGANATTPYASLRVTVMPDGWNLRFDVTWD